MAWGTGKGAGRARQRRSHAPSRRQAHARPSRACLSRAARGRSARAGGPIAPQRPADAPSPAPARGSRLQLCSPRRGGRASCLARPRARAEGAAAGGIVARACADARRRPAALPDSTLPDAGALPPRPASHRRRAPRAAGPAPCVRGGQGLGLWRAQGKISEAVAVWGRPACAQHAKGAGGARGGGADRRPHPPPARFQAGQDLTRFKPPTPGGGAPGDNPNRHPAW